jgi:hypothetical protein
VIDIGILANLLRSPVVRGAIIGAASQVVKTYGSAFITVLKQRLDEYDDEDNYEEVKQITAPK